MTRPEERATAVVFPFDAFGSGGTADGAKLLGDVLREILDDAALEDRPTRQDAFAKVLDIQELPFDTLEALAHWRATGAVAAEEVLSRGGFTLWLAGNHLGVLPVYERLGRRDLVVQFDAHLDCYDLHDTTEELSHGNWLRHAKSLPVVANVGHRDLFLTPKEVKRWFAAAIPSTDVESAAGVLRKLAAKADRLWIDIDADVFDPSVCPAVRQPLPFGLGGLQVLSLVKAVWSDKVAGVSVSEFDPGRDVRDAGLNLLGWLLEWVLLTRGESASV